MKQQKQTANIFTIELTVKLTTRKPTTFKQNPFIFITHGAKAFIIINPTSILIISYKTQHFADKKDTSTLTNPYKQYQTKLTISSQRWLLFDYRTHQYKRGWKPAQQDQFSGILRLFLIAVFNKLYKENNQIGKLNVRVNTVYLREQIQLARMKKQKKSNINKQGILIRDAITRALDNNMVINIIDLMYGIMMTNYQDLVQYAVVFVGYLCYCYMHNIHQQYQHVPYNYVSNIKQAMAYTNYFQQYLTTHLIPYLNLSHTYFNAKTLQIISCCNDACLLYLHLQSTALYGKIMGQLLPYKFGIKYMLGYNFWENRQLQWKNQRPKINNNNDDYQVVICWKGLKDYSVIAKNKELQVLIVLQLCKFGMMDRDVKKVQGWVRDMRKPIVQKKLITTAITNQTKTNMFMVRNSSKNKLNPVIKISEQSPDKIQRRQIKRAVTQL